MPWRAPVGRKALSVPMNYTWAVLRHRTCDQNRLCCPSGSLLSKTEALVVNAVQFGIKQPGFGYFHFNLISMYWDQASCPFPLTVQRSTRVLEQLVWLVDLALFWPAEPLHPQAQMCCNHTYRSNKRSEVMTSPEQRYRETALNEYWSGSTKSGGFLFVPSFS